MDDMHLWDMLAAAQWNYRAARHRLNGVQMLRWGRRMNYLQRLIDIKTEGNNA